MSEGNHPCVVKFSGGRSSGMMLMELLRKKELKPERGDVIIFNNTSAEHPATYEFTRRIKKIAEEDHNIPFFWIEYASYENASRYGWKRISSYRLVNDAPYSEENKTGYHCKGEVFEELISLSGFVPNMYSRTCTVSLKIFITNAFLSDWFAQKQGIERLGHHRDTSMMTDADILATHKRNKGSVPDHILLGKKKFAMGRSFIRSAASFQDFTLAKLCFNNPAIKASVIGNKGQLFGKRAITFRSYLGIRKDEEHRIDKIKARIEDATGSNTTSLLNQPVNEMAVAPLIDNGITKQDVIDFWNNQTFNLNLPNSGLYSNCVYCPLKGKKKLLKIATHEAEGGIKSEVTPASIKWWAKIENLYSTDFQAEGRPVKQDKGLKYIGFFGATERPVYQQIKDRSINKSKEGIQAEFFEDEDYVPCNCTD